MITPLGGVRIVSTPNYYVAVPYSTDEQVALAESEGFLRIDRNSGNFTKVKDITMPISPDQIIPCEGIVGVADCQDERFLIVATATSHAGQIGEHIIEKVTAFQMLQIGSGRLSSVAKAYYASYNSVLASKHFFISRTANLSKFYSEGWDCENAPFSKGEPDFMWNHYAARELSNAGAENMCLALYHGFIHMTDTQIVPTPEGEVSLTFGLLTRRSTARAGTRYTRRGVDMEGNVANFAFTEQFLIVEKDGKFDISTHLQIRGSIPLFWRQRITLKYNPKFELTGDEDEDSLAFRNHFNKLVQRYGPVSIVNLIDKKGGQNSLGEQYEALVNSHKNIDLSYYWFDFHKECSKMRYDRLNLLLDMISKDLETHSFFTTKTEGQVQHGVVRTNCVDNLDRTNVVQSMIGRNLLNKQLALFGVERTGEEDQISAIGFNTVFKHMWADHADVMSLEYSGTGALKNDFTRTGRRTLKGLIDDGVNSLTRYVLNNFSDGKRQDSIDLFLGFFRPSAQQSQGTPKSLRVTRSMAGAESERPSPSPGPLQGYLAEPAHPHHRSWQFMESLVLILLFTAFALFCVVFTEAFIEMDMIGSGSFILVAFVLAMMAYRLFEANRGRFVCHPSFLPHDGFGVAD